MTGPADDAGLPPAITETLTYLLVQIAKAHRNRAQELLNDIDLHVGQELLLLHLSLGDGMTQSELAEEICVQPATLTRSLDRLTRAGLVERHVDAEDQRVSRVYLTEEGRALRAPIERIWRELEAWSFANLTTEERLLLRRLLLQVSTNVQQ
jgi:MarR family transcriptional regulator, organic hydroperoxide resistance regulator